MRPQQQQGRRRNNRGGSNNNNNNNNNNNRNRNQNPLQRSYESNGPDVKIRGNPQTIADKYLQLARDALSAGDTVMAESYFQHAEHYIRIIEAAQPTQKYRDHSDPNYTPDEGEDGAGEADETGETVEAENVAEDEVAAVQRERGCQQSEREERNNNNNRNRNRNNNRNQNNNGRVPEPIFESDLKASEAAASPKTQVVSVVQAAEGEASVASEAADVTKPCAVRKPRVPKEIAEISLSVVTPSEAAE